MVWHDDDDDNDDGDNDDVLGKVWEDLRAKFMNSMKQAKVLLS